jgi:formamidopyrimidine-DNA glycosylase
MPELPEVETIRRQLEREIVKKKIANVEVLTTKILKRNSKVSDLIKQIEGKYASVIDRKGKYLIIELDSAVLIVIHLGMSGQIQFVKKLTKRLKKDEVNPLTKIEKHTHIIFHFADGDQLRFVDPRTFGEFFITSRDDGVIAELSQLGFDPLDGNIRWVDFERLLKSHTCSLKTFLVDQSLIAGIGNIYADEILFAAGLRFDRDTSSLGPQEVRRLYRSIGEILLEAVRLRGSSLDDLAYKDIYGNLGEYQTQHMVYNRDKKPCKRCRGIIEKTKVQGRTTYFCPLCQI